MKRKPLIVLILFFVLFVFSGCINIAGTISSQNKVTITGKTKISVEEVVQLEAKVYPATLNQEVKWSSDNDYVVDVDDQGVIVGKNVGRATITAVSVADEKAIGYLYINVVAISIDLSVAPKSIEIIGYKKLTVGELTRYEIAAIPNNANNNVQWESNNNNVVTIDEKGFASAKGEGTATITAKSVMNDVVATITVNVKAASRPEDLEEAVQNAFSTTKDSVLGVASYNRDTTTNKLSLQWIGSGFVYKCYAVLKDGTVEINVDEVNKNDIDHYLYYLLSNKHVVEKTSVLKVYLHQTDEEIPATLIQYDTKIDVGVVMFESEKYFEPLRFFDCDNLKSGTFAIAIGNPESFDFSSSITFGIISAPKRYISTDTDGDDIADWDAEYIQHDVSINPGNSGGPLLNLYGQVLGINTLKFSSVDIDNMGFSIPSNEVMSLLPYLENGDTIVRATIGITVMAVKDILSADLSSLDYDYNVPNNIVNGLYITNVSKDSVAERGGILKDDILVSFNGVELTKSLQLRAELNKIAAGSNQEIEVVVIRNGARVTLKLVF